MAHIYLLCPECISTNHLKHLGNFRDSRGFREHVTKLHDKNHNRWFKQWSGDFFKLNPQFQLYFGIVNGNYGEGNK